MILPWEDKGTNPSDNSIIWMHMDTQNVIKKLKALHPGGNFSLHGLTLLNTLFQNVFQKLIWSKWTAFRLSETKYSLLLT